LNLTASAFPGACPGVSERIQMSFSLQIEDSPPLAAGSFNSLDWLYRTRNDKDRDKCPARTLGAKMKRFAVIFSCQHSGFLEFEQPDRMFLELAGKVTDKYQ